MFIYDPAIKWFKNIMLTIIILNQAIILKKPSSQLICQRLEDLRK